jgi:predicted unusual protein kinase regulating ubiquinone biosynthesis (AarF/ABC1/UbiB family)
MAWTVDQVEATRAQVKLLVESAGQQGDALLRKLSDSIADKAQDGSPQAMLEAFFLVLELVRRNQQHRTLPKGEVDNAMSLAHRILQLNGIRPVTSRLSYLISELNLAEASVARLKDNGWTALGKAYASIVALRAENPHVQSYRALEIAQSLLALGNLKDADAELRPEIIQGLSGAAKTEAILLKARIAALQFDEKTFEWISSIVDQSLEVDVHIELAWRKLVMQCQSSEDFAPLLPGTSTRGQFRRHSCMAAAQFWLRAGQSLQLMGRLPKVASVKRIDSVDAVSAEVWEAAQVLEATYDRERPFAQRVEQLIAAFDLTLPIDIRLPMLVAGARFCFRHSQTDAGNQLLSTYSSLSRQATGVEDCCRLARDLLGKKKVTETPTEGSVAKFARDVTMSGIKHRIARFAPIRYRNREATKLAQFIVTELSALRGPMVKVIQLASLVTEDLPQPVQEALQSVQDQLIPAPFDHMRDLLEGELGPIGKHFSEFDPIPIAAASIGQVYRAVLHSGQVVAVKVQYPGIREKIAKDVAKMRGLRAILKMIFPRAPINELIDESEIQLMHECDYRREAFFQSKMQLFSQYQKGVIVPKIFNEASTDRVLTMEYFAGKKITDFCHSAPQEVRDRFGEQIVRFAMDSFLVNGYFNADGHAGNYLVTDAAELVHLDFGASYRIAEARKILWVELLQAAIKADLPTWKHHLEALGFIADKRFNFEVSLQSSQRIMELGSDGDPISLPKVKAMFRAMTMQAANRQYITIHREDLTLPRYLFSMLLVVASIGSRLNWRPMIVDCVERSFERIASGESTEIPVTFAS